MDKVYTYKFYDHPITQLYHIRIADGHPKGGWYVQLTSIESLVGRMLNRWYDHHYLKGKTQTGVFGRYDRSEYHDNERLNISIGEENYYRNQEISFDSVWDFYDYIGYNHKDKTMKTLDKLITNWKIEK
ncbi:hypothetical protein 65p190 [Aeromonas phage 65]|uniref:Uncharacterized protein n=2 Tax=Ishigurovirus osborne TaxID=260149 RepID=A0A219YC31_9CAUD|nr:hypothetical protein ST65p190 [Aeromonas phage 65]ADQ53198.1 hypothetical protein 65p190 [Aeromonas phage 65]APU01574.1 hypothetical protein [Aeromonas phage 65.2]